MVLPWPNNRKCFVMNTWELWWLPTRTQVTHLCEKIRKSQTASNNFSSLVFSQKINFKTKIKLFHTVSWCANLGMEGTWTSWKITIFFLKKISPFIPNYLLLVQTGLSKMYLYTHRLHLRYINKVQNISEEVTENINPRDVWPKT